MEIVSELVSGMGLHPVAVELSKTTKMLDLGDLAAHYAGVADTALVYLDDSLQLGNLRQSRVHRLWGDGDNSGRRPC